MQNDLVIVSQQQMNTILLNMNALLEEIIINEVDDYKYMQERCWTITSTMKRKIRQKLEAEFLRVFKHHFPRIQRRIVNELTEIIYASVRSLFKVCDKYTLPPPQLKLFIYNLLSDLLTLSTGGSSTFLFENANILYTDSSEGDDDPISH